MDRTCYWCQSEATGTVRVPAHVHPDEIVVVCGDCCWFIVSVLSTTKELETL